MCIYMYNKQQTNKLTNKQRPNKQQTNKQMQNKRTIKQRNKQIHKQYNIQSNLNHKVGMKKQQNSSQQVTKFIQNKKLTINSKNQNGPVKKTNQKAKSHKVMISGTYRMTTKKHRMVSFG